MKRGGLSGGAGVQAACIALWTVLTTAETFCPVFAQDIDPAIEALVDPDDGMTDPEELERLEAFRRTPIPLNEATQADLEQLPWISPAQARAILAWRDRNGPFPALEALRRVPGMAEETVERIRPFVTIRSPAGRISGWGRLTDSRREQEARLRQRWLGVQTGMRIGGRLEGGARLERREPGDAFGWRSGYIAGARLSVIERLLIGHFDAEYGQGLVLGERSLFPSGSGFGVSVKRRSRGLQPSRATRQASAYRGWAAHTRLRSVHLIAIAGRRRAGGRIHALRIDWTNGASSLGASAAMTGPAPGEGAGLRRKYGLDFDVASGPANLFGEAAFDGRGYGGFQAGIRWDAGRLEGGMVFRHAGGAFRLNAADGYRGAMVVQLKPDRATTAQVRLEVRLRAGIPVRTHTLRLRRRMGTRTVLSGLWQQEAAEGGRKAVGGVRRLQGQADWHPARVWRLRARMEQKRRDTGNRTLDGLLDARYQARDRTTISVQWWGVSGWVAPDLQTAAAEEAPADVRSRWALQLQSPLAQHADLTIRYTQTRSFQPARMQPLRPEVSWSVQMSMTW
jgi:competence ComEA-like helix-hairpin-helix protein